MAKQSQIKVPKDEKTKKVIKKKKAEAAIEKIVEKMEAIQKEYAWAETYFDRILKKSSTKGGAMGSDNAYYNTVKDAKDLCAKRAEYCQNRIKNLERNFNQDIGQEADYLAKRLSEVEAKLAELQKQKTEDTDVA